MNRNHQSLALIITVLLTSNYQNCSPEGFRSISSISPENYLSSNSNLNSLSKFSTPEDTNIEGQALLYADPSSRIKYRISLNPTLGKFETFNETTAEFKYVPNENSNGTDSFEVVAVVDGSTESAPHRLEIEILPINDFPVAANGNLNTNEDIPVQGTLVGSDVDSTSLEYSIVSMPQKGTIQNLNLTTGSFRYVPNANSNGTDSFSFKIKDQFGFSNVGSISVNLNNINDAPTATPITAMLDEDKSVSVKLLGSDPDGDALTFRLIAQPANGVVTNFNAATGTFTYTPKANFNGSDLIQFVARDASVDSATGAVAITVKAINDAPTVQSLTLTTNLSGSTSANFVASDIDSVSLNFQIVTNGKLGTATVFGSTLIYTPKLENFGQDQVTVSVSDGLAYVNTTVNIQNFGHRVSTKQNVCVLKLNSQVLCRPMDGNEFKVIPINVAATPMHIKENCILFSDGKVKCIDLFFGEFRGLFDLKGTKNIPIVNFSGPCILYADGSAENCYGDIGSPSTASNVVSGNLTAIQNSIIQVASHGSYVSSHSCFVLQGNILKCFGSNYAGQLGNQTKISSIAPVDAIGIQDTTQVTTAFGNTCALNKNKTVKCWGEKSINYTNFTSQVSVVPEQLPLTDVVRIASGSFHTCALLGNGAVRCWGYNLNGQLGNNSQSNSYVTWNSPVTASGLSGVVELAADGDRTCAGTSSNQVYCWGGLVLNFSSLVPKVVTSL